MSLKISQFSQKHTCPGVSYFKKLPSRVLQLYYLEALAQICPVDFVKFVRKPILKNTCEQVICSLLFSVLWRTMYPSVTIIQSMRLKYLCSTQLFKFPSSPVVSGEKGHYVFLQVKEMPEFF